MSLLLLLTRYIYCDSHVVLAIRTPISSVYQYLPLIVELSYLALVNFSRYKCYQCLLCCLSVSIVIRKQ